MTPAEYVQVVVLPTVREFMLKPDDRRLAYLSAIAAFHIPDYVMRAAQPETKVESDTKLRSIRDALRSELTFWYDVIEGMANGVKHGGRDPKRGASFKPGDEEYVPPFGFGEGFGSFGQGRWDGPGLRVLVPEGHIYVDNAIGYFLLACARLFPDHIPGIQPSDWDPKFKTAG